MSTNSKLYMSELEEIVSWCLSACLDVRVKGCLSCFMFSVFFAE